MPDPRARLILTAENQTDPAFRAVEGRLRSLEGVARSSSTGLRGVTQSFMGLRNVLAGLGLVLSARALGNWIEAALRSKNATDEQRASLERTGAALTGLNTEAQKLAITMATALAPAIEHAAKVWRQFLFPTEGESANARLEEMQKRAVILSRALVDIQEGRAIPARGQSQITNMRVELEQLLQQITLARGEVEKLTDAEEAAIAADRGLVPFDEQAIGRRRLPVDEIAADRAAMEARMAEAAAKDREREEEQVTRRRELLTQQLEQVEVGLMSETELEVFAYQQRQEILDRALEDKLVSEQRHSRLSHELARRRERNITDIQRDEVRKRRQLQAQTLGAVAGLFAGIAAISAAGADQSKKKFEQDKKIQKATAIVNTLAGVTQALAAYPPPLSFIWAAAVAAFGLAQVKQIGSTTWSGEGGTFSGAGGGGGGAGAVAPPPADLPLARSEARSAPTINITITGIVGRIDGATAREIGAAIGEEINRNDFELVDRNSRQAFTIRGTG